MCRSWAVMPMLSATARASLNAASWASIEGLPGSSAEAKCDHRPTTVTRPASSASLAAASSPGQSAGAAPPRLSPVSAFRWTRAGRPATVAAAASRRTRSADPGRQVHLGRDGGGMVVLGDGHQAQDRLFEAGVAQLQRLGHVHDAQPVGAAGDRRAGGRNRAVTVPVGLDHRHYGGGGHVCAHRRDVPGNRAELDASLRMAVHSH